MMTSTAALIRLTPFSLPSYLVFLVSPAPWSRSTVLSTDRYRLFPMSHGNVITITKGLPHAKLQSWSPTAILYYCDVFFYPLSYPPANYLGFPTPCVVYLVTNLPALPAIHPGNTHVHIFTDRAGEYV